MESRENRLVSVLPYIIATVHNNNNNNMISQLGSGKAEHQITRPFDHASWFIHGFPDNKMVSVEGRGKQPVLLPLTRASDAVRWRQSVTVRYRPWSSRRSLVSCRLRGCHCLRSPRTPAQTTKARALTGADTTVATAASTQNCSTQSSMAIHLKSASKY